MSITKPWNAKYMTGPTDQTAAFDDVFERLWPRIHRLLIAIVGDPAEAEDLAIESFYKLSQRPQLLEDGQNPAAWLYRVASNLGYNALRSARRRGRYETEAHGSSLRIAIPGPEDETSRRMEVAQVRSVLASMKARDAKLLLLKHTGLSYAELAETLGIAPGSVGSLLTRAERKFARRYRQLYDGD